MKVNNNISRVLNIYSKNVSTKNEQINKTNKKDTVEISSKGRELQKYIELSKNTEIINGKIDEIKKLIDEGRYYVDTEKITDSIIKYIEESDE